MKTQLLLLAAVAASCAGFDYFVKRKDGRGVCVTNEQKLGTKDLIPTYSIGGGDGVEPRAEEEKWSDGWQMKNLSVFYKTSPNIELNHKIVWTDGSGELKLVVEGDDSPGFLLQAANATLVLSENQDWRKGKSVRVRLNYRFWYT